MVLVAGVVSLVLAIVLSFAPVVPVAVGEEPREAGVYGVDWGYEYVLPGGDIVELGNRDTVGFEPHLKLNRWNGECWLTLQPAGEIEEEIEYEVDGNRVKCKYKVKQGEFEFEWETEFYPLEPNNQYELGGFEFEVLLLLEKPETNEIVFDIEAQDLRFVYQPALTPEEVADGAVRPDNVVGSYAVYHSTKRDHIIGQTNYKAGKAFHIYRPMLIDNVGDTAWADLIITDTELIIDFSKIQDWLDKAKYPVRIDPTFGYTEVGGTSADSVGDFMRADQFTGAAGTGTSMSAYVQDHLAINAKLKQALYKVSDGSFVKGTVESVMPDAADWVTQNFTPTDPTTEAVDYFLVMWGDNGWRYFYDVGTEGYWYDGYTYDGWPNPHELNQAAAERKISIYCTYTPEEGNPPTVTTQAASNIEATTATGNGNITAVNDGTCDLRGFVWDLDTHGDPGNVSPAISDYANDVPESNGFGTGAFIGSLTGLPTGDTIYVRAYAHNENGYGYGSEVNFLTKPAAPTNVAATDGVYTDKVVITWTKSTGATDYHVWRDAVDLGAAGDVATFDDTGADAPTITAGTASASDGTEIPHVVLSLAGESASNGTTHTYKVVASNATGNSVDSETDTGYRGVGALTYQWQRSAADSDAAYGILAGATTDPWNDTTAPADGEGRWYYCEVSATGAITQDSTHDRGYRGVLPTVTVQAVTDVSYYTATGNGNITNIGTDNCDKRGFVWDTGPHADPGNVAPGASGYANNGADTGDFGIGAYTYGLTELLDNQIYYVRAYVHNPAGYDYSDTEVNFTTDEAVILPGAPTDFTITQTGTNDATLTWTTGTDATTTVIRAKEGSYPTDITDGYEVYNGALETVDDTGLSLNIDTYYYRAWSHNATGYSENYAEGTIGGKGMILLFLGLFGLGFLSLGFIFKQMVLAWLAGLVFIGLSVVGWSTTGALYDIYWIIALLGMVCLLVSFICGILINMRNTEEYNQEVDEYYEKHPRLTEEEQFEREQREIRTSMLPQSLLKRYVNYRKMLKRPDSDYGEKE